MHTSSRYQKAEILGRELERRGLLLTLAESCTGGGIAEAVTAVAGSLAWFEMGFVTYSNAAKTQLLEVQDALLAQHGAVSEAVVQAMLAGALRVSKADVGIAVSGIAGPSGGTPEKPVGTVCFAWGRATDGHALQQTKTCHFSGDRAAVRDQSVIFGLEQMVKLLYKY